MSVIDYFLIKQELVVFLRNSAIMTTTLRGVTTTTQNDSLTSATSVLINRTNVRNVRSITIDATPINYGTDYLVNYYYNDAGTRKCRITFTVARTGASIITYDYGSDKIYPDQPQADLTINDFPQIRIDEEDYVTEELGIGNVLRTNFYFHVTVFSPSKTDIQNYSSAVRTAMVNNAKGFYHLTHFVRPFSTDPIIKNETFKDKIFSQKSDYLAPFLIEIN